MIATLLFATAIAAPRAVRPLSANSSIRDSLAAGEIAVFSIDVPAETAARLDVEQQGVDVEVTLRPAGSDLPKHGLDLVAGPTGTETRYLPISPAPATWNAFISTVLNHAERGDFTITVHLQPADDHAREVAANRQLYQETSDLDWLGTTEKTEKMCEAVAERAHALGDKELEAEATYQAARRHDVLGDVPGAIVLQQRALAMFRELGRRDREARALNRLGDYARKTGDIRQSEEYFKEALPIARESGDRIAEVDILNNSGLLLLSIGRVEEALEQLQSAIPLAQELGTANVEVALWDNAGECDRLLGLPDKAVEAHQRAVERVRHSDLPPRRLGRSLNYLAAAYFDDGRRTDAAASNAEALEVLKQAHDFESNAEALAFRGEMEAAGGESDRAGESFGSALPLFKQAQARREESKVLLAWSQLDLERGDSTAALQRIGRSLDLARQIAARDLEAKALYLQARGLQKSVGAAVLGRSAAGEGARRHMEIDRAIRSVSAAIGIVEDMRSRIARNDLRTSYLSTVESYYDLDIDLLQQRGRTAAAFDVNERARARVLLESLAASADRIRKGVDPELLARERDLRAELNAKDRYRAQVVLKQGASSPQAIALADVVAKNLTEWNELRAKIREASPAYAALTMPEPVTLGAVQRTLLDAHTALVEYHLGKSRSLAWVVDRTSITVHKLPPEASIDTLARQYHDLLSRDIDALSAPERAATTRAISTIGQQLAAAVWAPLSRRLRGKRVLIVAEGALQYVPFAALPGASGRPLIERHEIIYLPSASVLEAIRREHRPRPAARTALIFADPVFTPDDPRVRGVDADDPPARVFTRGGPYNRLRFSRLEAEAIVRAAGATSQEELDFSAAKKTLGDRDLSRYGIIHFATHGYVDSEQPDLSGLVLSLVDSKGMPIDGFLHLYDIYNLNLDANLVVLSACRTALGKEVHGEGLISLTRGFMYAGASRVVSSIWNIDDRASAQLMSAFYDDMLSKNMTPAAALRAAQIALLQQPRWANPHYWAAFGLQGEWR